jgi:beta-lactamase class A
LAVAVASIGPGALRETLSGLVFVRPPAASIGAPALHADTELQARLERSAGSLARGRVGAVVVDLETGATATLDADGEYPAASLFKLPVLVEVLSQIESGRLDAGQQLEIRPEDWTDGSGVLQARVGEQLAVRELMRLMIQESDNIAALVLLDAIGIDRVNATAERLGMHATRLVDHRSGDTAEHATSAADMASLLMSLATGQAVNQRVSEATLRLLELKQSVSWLRDGLPFWVKVAHKWGELPEARNDAGVLFTPRGAYVAVVLTEGVPPDESAGVIARASRAAYDYLGERTARSR